MDREQVNILYAMDTFKQMRNELIEKTIDKDPDIYLGLHSVGKNLSNAYMERTKVSWLLEHFEVYMSIINKNISPDDKKYRKECIEYFSSKYREYLEWCGKTFADSKIAIDLLKELEKVLNNIIFLAKDWEKECSKLYVMMAKNREKYINMRNQMKEE